MTKKHETLVIKTTGEVVNYTGEFNLKGYQSVVGGYIQVVRFPQSNGYVMICNEEGKLDNLPYNEVATHKYQNPHDFIVGDVLLIHESYLN